jgi:hypothetical protein
VTLRRKREWHVAGAIGVAIAVTVTACAGATSGHRLGVNSSLARLDSGQEVQLTPAVEAGWAGWCMSVAMFESSESCANVRSHGPILAERWTSSGERGVRGVVVASSDVTAVSLSDGTEIQTRREAGLPAGLRVAVVEIADPSRRTPEAVAGHGFIPLGEHGVRIAENGRREVSLGYEVRGEGWRAPTTAPHGLCAITVTGNRDVHAVRGGVVTEARSYPGLPGRAFVTCAGTEFAVDKGGKSLLASMLVDAAHPGSAPGPLPHMMRLPGRPGIYRSRAGGGEIVAKRVSGRAWLAVGNGPFTGGGVDFATRVALLSRLGGAVY